MKTNKSMQKLSLAILLAGVWSAAFADPVVFNVNLSVQTALGNFNAGNGDGVRVLGLNGDWSTGITMVPSAANTNIYTVTNSLTAGTYPNYLFVITPASGSWSWETTAAGGNRWLLVPAGGTNLPVVYFSDNTNLPAGSVSITFEVNMTSAIELGNFTIGSDYVNVFGSFDNWSTTGVLLTNVPGTSNYLGTLDTSSLSLGTAIAYKYAIDGSGGTWEGSVGAGGTQNRAFTVSATATNLPVDYWNNLTNVSTSYNITFTADMTAQTALGTFTPGVDSVYVNGDWNWTGYALALVQSGSNTNLYTNTLSLLTAPGATVNYKYTLDAGLVWENSNVGPGGNRQFRVTGDTNLPANYFNNVADLGPIAISNSGSQTILYWASGTNVNNHIHLQTASSLTGAWSEVAAAEGQSVLTNDFGPGPVFIRLVGP